MRKRREKNGKEINGANSQGKNKMEMSQVDPTLLREMQGPAFQIPAIQNFQFAFLDKNTFLYTNLNEFEWLGSEKQVPCFEKMKGQMSKWLVTIHKCNN